MPHRGFPLNPRRPLSGNRLRQAAKALARIQIAPQVHAYQRLAHELQGQQAADTLGLQRLGHRTGQSLANVYGGLAQNAAHTAASSQALAGYTQQNVANAAEQARAAYTGQVGGGLNQYLQSQQLAGGPGGGQAQQQLANLVALQEQNLQGTATAATQAAGLQGGAYAQASRGFANAAQMQGATAQKDIQQAINSRIAAQRLQAGQDIREALGQAAQAKALKGSTIIQQIMGLRGQDQQFILGKMATQQRAQAAAMSAASAAASRKQEAHQFQRTHKHGHTLGTTGGGSSGGSSGGSGGSGAPGKQRKRYQHIVKSSLRDVVNQAGGPSGVPNPGSRQWHVFLSRVRHNISSGTVREKPWVIPYIAKLARRRYGGKGGGGGGGKPGGGGHRAGP